MKLDTASPLPMAPEVMGLLLVHATLRRDTDQLTRAADDVATPRDQLVGRSDLLQRVLAIHHHGEDDLLLPALVRRQPGFITTSTVIREQHVALDAALERLARAARTGPRDDIALHASETRALLEDHLWTEEQHMLPVWLASFTQADHDELGRRLRRTTSLRDLKVMVPWLLEAAPTEFRALAAREVPMPLRIANRVWWRRSFERATGSAR